MKKILFLSCLAACCLCACTPTQTIEKTLKPRLVVLTDIAPADLEPDDQESLIRLLAHADLYEIEAIVATTGWNVGNYPVEWMDTIFNTLGAYEKDLPNLMKRSEQTSFLPIGQENQKQYIGYWPSIDYLRSRVMLGSSKTGPKVLGENNRSKGSDMIIQLADEADDRPIWISVWGGGNTLAQAIWQVKQTRTDKEFKEFLHKLRVYTVTDQDLSYHDRGKYELSSHMWMRQLCGKDLFFMWDESAWQTQNAIGSSSWNEYAQHIQGHGHLGARYPKNKYGVEGDTPSYLQSLPNGLHNPSNVNEIGWSGYYVWDNTLDRQTQCYTNTTPAVMQISRKYEHYFYPAIFANFAARMDWAKEGKGNRNPIVVVNGKKGLDAIQVKARAGQTVALDAARSYDPDGDVLSYKWWVMPESGSYPGEVAVSDASKPQAALTLPADAAGHTIHVICEIADNGEHTLTAYRRVIITVK
ncbi:MAG: DUF1593 domain-containing protein [Bacteroides sp.]|nr:DUF1593 domain-containing protein [Bacteroides sp.]